MNFFKSRRLRSDILSAFSALICITVSCEIIYSSTAHRELILDFEREYYSKIATRTAIGYLDSYFNQMEVILEILANDFDQKEQDKFRGFSTLFLKTLKNIPHILSFYMTLKNGEVLQARRTDQGVSQQGKNKNGSLPHAEYAIRKISTDQQSGNFTETWNYLNEGFGEVYSEVIPSTSNIFTKREWYTKTETSKIKIWSDAYIFKTTNSVGITLSTPLGYDDNANVIGVLCVDFVLDSFKEILKSIQISKNSRTYLVNSKNEILASSNGNEQFISDNATSHELILTKITDSTDPVIDGAAKAVFGSDKDYVNFSVNDVEYVVSVGKLSKLPFSILTITPQTEFTDFFENITREMMFLFLMIFLFSTIVILFLSRRISKPITMLCDSARAIGKMDLENYPNPPKSNILEIKQLSNAMNAMKLNVTTFTKYAPKDLVSKLVAQGISPELGGKTSNITILFSDIEKFSTIAENLPAEYLILHLSEYFDELTKEIMKCNGIIDKYIGDSIMAIWGAPNTDDDQIINACMAGLRCQAILNTLHEKWRAVGKPPLPTRIGLHSGSAVVGNIGSHDRMNFTAIGDVVNIASRLEGANKYYGIYMLASEDIEAVARGRILFRVVDRIAVKGRNTGITVYEPLCSLENVSGEKYYSLIDLCSKSRDAFGLYQERRFAEAIELYSAILKIFPWIKKSVDPILKNCKQFLNEVPDDWDGINRLESK
ncbi:MAG: adenylate/guanylate cyclase domain-containing protein [Holosporales bacterium]|nr:adenylate/guanylate cyclase domain-containing protein [Holosporales bacterium]